ncbi:hypothetical protein ABIE44_001661 [Marmoricola sp. OAE513]|uniref:lamin tail domain-containing protein n=1 Tax=Marmoricola sp. OAE513 TaxID=2817894 RepID=UPI001AE4E6D7
MHIAEMNTFRTRSVIPAVIGLFALVLAGLVLVAPAFAADSDVKINEFSSNNPDFVELINTGSGSVDISGWVLKDNSESNPYTVPAGTTLAAGEIRGFSGEGVEFAFGLGNGDSVRLFTPGSATLIDSVVYAAHPAAGKSWGRCPDGTGSIVLTQAATKGSANSCGVPDSAVKINEFSSNNPDFVELYNTGSGPVDLSGWQLKDNSENNIYTFPAGSSIAAGEFKGLSGESVEFAFGLGNGDSVRLYSDADLVTPLDSYSYPAHPAAGKSYARCPNGTGSFVISAAATKGASNSCPLPAGAENIKVNEVQSDPADLVELTNVGETTVDLGGYVLKDNDDTHLFTIPTGTSLAAHGYVTFDVNVSFGLGKGDSVRLYTPDLANLLDSTTYPPDTHAANWGRCPDGTGTFGTMTSTLGAGNACAPAGPPDVVINEVESNGDQVADWVELKNRGASPFNISGWKIVDGDPAHAATPVVVPAATTIPAGGYYAIYTEINQTPGFGLGVGDSVTLYLADGTTQVDTTTWGAHSPTTWGRCPDGTGTFGDTTTSTRGLANACSPVRINEVESDGGSPADWVELVNISNAPVDVSGFVLKDNDDAHSYAIPASTSIAAKGYLVLNQADLGFELDNADSVRLFAADGSTLIETYTWASHAAQSYGRCKDGVGNFADTKATTKGAANSCPGLETTPWPGGQTVTTADKTETFLQDLSGLVFDPTDPNTLWAAQNKKGTLFKLTRDADNNFVPVSGWPKDPKYPSGTGAPDTEGITLGPDGFVYLASERNNDASGVSRMSVLRYDPAATGTTISATNEWDLTSKIPAAGANLGLEGITWVPDSYLVGNGFVDPTTGSAYTPSTYPNHGTGLYAVAVEATGAVHLFALNNDGTSSTLVATIASGFPALADVDFDPELQRIRAVTDDTVDGKTSLLKIDAAGAFVVDAAFDRPVGMPNLNNEGLAVAAQSTCVAGKKEVLWSDDGDTDGHSLRRGTISCMVLELTAPVPTVSGTPAVGQTLTATPGTWGPAPVALTYQWFAGADPIDGATSSTLVLGPAQLTKTITVKVTGTKTGYPTTTKTSEATAAVAAGALTAPVPTIGGTAKVGETLTATVGSWGPDPVALTYQWFAGADPISGATGTTLALGAAHAAKVITIAVTGTKTGYATTTKTSTGTAAVVNGTLTGPVPTISGTVKVGGTLTATAGTWGPDPVALTYQWFAGSTPIAGANGTTLVVPASQVDSNITVVVTGTKAGYTTLAKTSAPTAPVGPGTLSASTPTISGTPALGATLTATPGTWGPDPVKLNYQWLSNGGLIAGATTSTLVLAPAQVGTEITVVVAGTKLGYTSASRVSAATATVTAGSLTAPTPTVTGTAKVGVKLTAVPGTWGPASVALTFQWFANGIAIPGATASTFTPTGAHAGRSVTVKVTGTKTGYTTRTVASAGKTVAVGTLTTGKPKITGTVKVGKTLTATAGTWGPAPVTLKYQWKIGGKSVSGATGKTFKVPASAKGKKIAVTVTGTKTGYKTVAVTSASTKKAAGR